MKIIAWNCNMAFRKKYEYLVDHGPDILVIPECENPVNHTELACLLGSMNPLWLGDNKSKGLGVFAKPTFKLKIFPNYNPKFKYILPIQVRGPVTFNLFAVWTMPDKAKVSQRYIGQLWLALNYYENSLQEPAIICGDFNSNAIWDNDKPKKIANHTRLVDFLAGKDIFSSYHHYFQEKQGQETRPTQYMYRKLDKPYHLDYCFVSRYFLNRLKKVEIGDFSYWQKYSDHVPVMVTLGKG